MIELVSYTLKTTFPKGARDLATALKVTPRARASGNSNLVVSWGKIVPSATINPKPVSNLAAFDLFKKANIPVPKVITDGFLVRSAVHHGGKDIIPILDSVKSHFLVQYINKVREYRVDLWRAPDWSKTVVAFRSHVKRGNPKLVNWNRDQTEWRSYGKEETKQYLPSEVVSLAKKALWAVDYHFGSVDIVEAPDGQFFVLEINSAPMLNEQGITKLATRILDFESRNKKC